MKTRSLSFELEILIWMPDSFFFWKTFFSVSPEEAKDKAYLVALPGSWSGSLQILFPTKKNQGSLEKWLILTLKQEMYWMFLGFLMPEIKEAIKMTLDWNQGVTTSQ